MEHDYSYLGIYGLLQKIPITPKLSLGNTTRHTFTTTLEGRQKAQVSRFTRRKWSGTAESITAEQLSILSEWFTGAYSNGPLVLFTPDSMYTNMLSPEEANSDIDNIAYGLVSRSGRWDLGGGIIASNSYTSITPGYSPNLTYRSVPVIPGQTYTVSGWLQGENSQLRMFYYSQEGTTISSPIVGNRGNLESPTRCSATITPPDNAVRMAIGSIRATKVARPALTLGNTLRPWSIGKGCYKCVLNEFDYTLDTLGESYCGEPTYTATYTITEIG